MNILLDFTYYDFEPKPENYFGSLNHTACYYLDFCSAMPFTDKGGGDVIVGSLIYFIHRWVVYISFI